MKKQIIIIDNGKKIMKEMSLEECAIYFEGAVKKWSNELYTIIKNMSNNLMEYDDFYGEGMICLIEVYKRYRPINTFNTTLHKSLDNLKIDLIRKTNAKKRKTEYTVVSLDIIIDEGWDSPSELHELEGEVDENFSIIEFDEDIKNALTKLNEDEKKIFNFLIENESTKRALAKELKVSRPTLDSKISKVRDKVLSLLPEYFLYQIA